MVDRTPSDEPAADDGDTSLDSPNCPACLHRMEPAETASGEVHWLCLECGQRSIA